MNVEGQSDLNIVKQKAIESFIRRNNYDVVLLQEIDIKNDSFENCDYINSNYVIYSNNARNAYETATMVSSNLRIGGVWYDEEGRAIIMEIEKYTEGNAYLPSGTDHRAKQRRDRYCSRYCQSYSQDASPHG